MPVFLYMNSKVVGSICKYLLQAIILLVFGAVIFLTPVQSFWYTYPQYFLS